MYFPGGPDCPLVANFPTPETAAIELLLEDENRRRMCGQDILLFINRRRERAHRQPPSDSEVGECVVAAQLQIDARNF